MAKPKIAIDAGHGSNTAGKRTPPFTKEVDINKDGTVLVRLGEQYREHYANTGVAVLLYDKLVNRGYKVIKTGWDDNDSADDPDESLSSRQSRIKEAGCDYSISIHFNAFGDGISFNNAKGDTLRRLSIKFLKDGSRYKEIMAFNKLESTVIIIGQILKIPIDVL